MEHLISFFNLPPAVRFLAVGILNLLILLLLLCRIESLQTQIIIIACIVDDVGYLLLLVIINII